MTVAVDGSSGGAGKSAGDSPPTAAVAADKAGRFFDRGRDVADAGNFDYAIELFIHGLSLTPDDLPAHKELRLIGLERTARGGNDISNFDKIKLREAIIKSTDPMRSLLIAEKLLAFDPGNVEWTRCCADHARSANLERTAEWFAQLCEES